LVLISYFKFNSFSVKKAFKAFSEFLFKKIAKVEVKKYKVVKCQNVIW